MAKRGKEILAFQGPITYEEAEAQIDRLRKGSYLHRMKGEFIQRQDYAEQILVNGEYIPTGVIWSKRADGKYRSFQIEGELNDFEINVGVQNKELVAVETKFNMGQIP